MLKITVPLALHFWDDQQNTAIHMRCSPLPRFETSLSDNWSQDFLERTLERRDRNRHIRA